MEPKKTRRRIVKWTGIGLLALLLMVAAPLALLQSPPVKRHAGAWISAAVSRGEDLQVSIPRVEGFLPFDFRLPRVTVKDREGEWLELEEVLIRWSPADLLWGKIRVNEAVAAQVRWERLPGVSTAGQSKKAPGPGLPEALPPVYLERLVIQRLLVGPSVLGRRASFLVNGRMKILKASGSVFGSLLLQRTDGPRGLVRINASLSGKNPTLALGVRMEEDKNGILASLLSLPCTGPLVFTLKGAGPLDSWKGQLRSNAEGLGTVSADVAFQDREEGLQISGAGVLGLSPGLAEPKVSPFMKKKEVCFSIDLGFENSGQIVLQESSLRTDLAGLSLTGRFAPATGEVEGRFHFQMPETGTLSALAGADMHGALEATGKILGSMQKPVADISLTLERPRIGVLEASRISSDLRVSSTGKGSSLFQGLSIEGSGKIMDLHNPKIQGWLQPTPIRWTLKGEWSGGGSLSVEDFWVAGGPARLRLSGDADLAALTFKGQASGDIPDLSALGPYRGQVVYGTASIGADVQVSIPEKAVSAVIRGRLRNLRGLDPLVVDFIGDEVRFEGGLDLKQFRHLDIEEMKIFSKTAELSVNGAVELEKMASRLRGHLSIPLLSMVPVLRGESITGVLAADIAVDGTLTGPRVVVQADGRNVSFRGLQFDGIKADLDIEGLPRRPRGDARLRLTGKTGQTFFVDASIAPEEGGTRISGLTLRSEGTKLSGNLLVHGSGHTLEGMLQAETNLADLTWVLGQGWGGTGRFTARFSESGGRQELDYEVSGTGIRTPYGRANHFSLTGRLEDAFALGNVRADIEVGGLERNGLTLRELSLEGKGDRKGFAFSGHASGKRNRDFQLETRGVCDLAQNHITMQVNELKGQYGGHPVLLQEPLVISRGPEGYSAERAHFKVGQGQLQASFRSGKDAVQMEADFHALSLEMLSLVGGPDLLGLATGRVSLRGTLTSPQGELHVDLTGVALRDPRFHKVPAAAISGKAEYARDLLHAHLTIKGVSQAPVEADMEIPVQINLSPPLLAFRNNGDIRARLSGQLDLQHLADYVAMEDQTLKGRFSADITAAGRPGDIRWGGSLVLADGAYTNARTGTNLQDIQARAVLAGDSLILEKAVAKDGAAGSLSLGGRVKLSQGDDFPYQLKATLKDCVLIRTDDLTGHTAGDLTLSGSMQGASLAGEITIGPAEARIPERLPPEVPSMHVIEVNVPEKAGPPPEKSPWKFPAKFGLAVHLDLPGRVFVRGRGLESEWSGKLQVSGDTQSPVIRGTLRIVRGNFNFFGKIFSLAEGTILFDGNTPPSPQMNITAVYTKGDLTARIILSGTPAAPRISIESDPSLPTDEILSRIFFRRSMSEISPVQALQIASAANTLAGGSGGINDFMDKVRGFLGVDYIGLKESEEGTNGTTLGVGKYLSDKVYLEAEQGMETNSGKVSVQVEITPNISIESETGADANAGVGINWKWQY